MHGDAHCLVAPCSDFVKVNVVDESRLEIAISTASGEGGMRFQRTPTLSPTATTTPTPSP